MIKNSYLFGVLILTPIFLLSSAQSALASAQVEIWDNGTTDWTTTFANGDPVDTGTANSFRNPNLVTDSNGNVYVAYSRLDGDEEAKKHIYLSRYNGSDVSVWDNDTTSWTTTSADGDPIDVNVSYSASEAQLAIDSDDNVYITYSQSDGSNGHIYLSRYNGTDVRVWDNDTTAWTTTFANGDPVDTGTTNDASSPQLAIDSTGKVYLTYYQSDGSNTHIYLSRYDGTDVEIWDNGATAWTTTLANGDPIDTGTDNQAQGARLAIDSDDNIYVIYLQLYDSNNHIYLSRYDGTDVEIWDNGAAAWTTTFANGDPIDNSTYGQVSDFDIAIDSHNDVYLFFSQSNNFSETYLSRYTEAGGVSTWATTTSSWSTTLTNAGPINPSDGSGYAYPRIAIDHNDNVYLAYDEDDNGKILLSRYNGEDVRIWDNNTAAWITTFANGDPVDPRIDGGSYYYPEIAIDATNNVYLTYYDDTTNHVYLSRYDGISAKIWDNDTAAWTTTLANGDPIDTGTDNQAQEARLAIDSDNNVYVTYYQNSGSYSRIYLSRYFADAVSVTAPTATSSAATAITSTGAVFHGNITATGGESNTIRGFQYGTTTAYGSTASTTDTYDVGEFSTTITGLTPATTYHYLAYSVNSAGTGTSTDQVFTTLADLPTATSSAATEVTASAATLHGNITATGGESNTSRGFEYGLTTAYGSTVSTSGTYTTGIFTADLSGLEPSTTYHFRAFSVNSAGTGTSTDLNFTTDTRSSSGSAGYSRRPPSRPVTPPVNSNPPSPVSHATIRQFVNLLITIGVIAPDKVDLVRIIFGL